MSAPQKEKIQNDYDILFREFTDFARNPSTQQIENQDLKDFKIRDQNPLYINRILEKEIVQKDSDYTKHSNKILKYFLLKKYILSVFIKLISSVLLYSCTFFLDLLTNKLRKYAPDSDTSSRDLHIIFIYMFGTLSVFLLSGVMEVQSSWNINKNKQYFGSVLRILLYRKTLQSYNYQSQSSSNEDNKQNKKGFDLNNVMSSDINQCQNALQYTVDIFSTIMEIIIALSLLYSKIGNSIQYTIIFMLCLTIINMYATIKQKLYFRNVLRAKDKRLGLTADILSGMKSLKYLCWEKLFQNKINQARLQEYANLVKVRFLDGGLSIFWNSISYILLMVTIVDFVNKGHKLQDLNIFTIMTIFRQLISPLGNLPYIFQQVSQLRISLQRINSVLNIEDISESNIINLDKSQYNSLEIGETVIHVSEIKMNFPTMLEENTKQKFKVRVKELQLKKGTLNFLVGEVGSGKTAFLLGLMNEMKLEGFNSLNNNGSLILSNSSLSLSDINQQLIPGKVSTLGKIVYVPQNHWLRSGTIKENILFGEKYDEQRYLQCIEACELLQDLKQVKGGDHYDVGPDGMNLSGGQRQRISLCRALYQNGDIYLLDDCLSSVDVHVADKIFEKVIKKLLLKQQKTVVMSTSQYQYIDSANKVIYFNNGRIFEQTKEAEQFIQRASLNQARNTLAIKAKTQELKNNLDSQRNNAEIHIEKRKIGKAGKDVLQIYIKAIGYLLGIVYISSPIVVQGWRSLIDFWLKNQIPKNGEVSQKVIDPSEFIQNFLIITVTLVVLTTLRALLYALASNKAAKTLFDELNMKIMMSKMYFFDQNPVGRIINRVSADVQSVDNYLPFQLYTFADYLCYFISVPVGIIIQMYWLTPVMIFMAYIMIRYINIYRNLVLEVKRLDLVNNSQVLVQINETLSGTQVIRAFNKQNQLLSEFLQKIGIKQQSQQILDSLGLWCRLRLNITSFFSFLILMTFCAFNLIYDFSRDYTSLSLILTYMVTLTSSLNKTLFYMTSAENSLVSVERIGEYLNNEQEDINEKPKNKQMVHPELLNLSADDYIVFKDVNLSYSQKSVQNKKYSLKNVNITVKKGEKVAICGRTGSGKTSILNALFSLYEKDSGYIFVKGLEQSQMNLKQLRSQMAIIPQFGFLYEDTLSNNIDPEEAFLPEILEQKIKETGFIIRAAIKQTPETENIENSKRITFMVSQEKQLRLTQFKRQDKPTGNEDIDLKFNVAKSGGNLSNGEKQIINFFRIILKNTDILCLDEASSYMDPETDQKLNDALFAYASDKALLVITHRLENIHLYDKVYVMENGVVVECGNFNELRQVPGSFFYQNPDIK